MVVICLTARCYFMIVKEFQVSWGFVCCFFFVFFSLACQTSITSLHPMLNQTDLFFQSQMTVRSGPVKMRPFHSPMKASKTDSLLSTAAQEYIYKWHFVWIIWLMWHTVYIIVFCFMIPYCSFPPRQTASVAEMCEYVLYPWLFEVKTWEQKIPHHCALV